jgi:hypothetical protein
MIKRDAWLIGGIMESMRLLCSNLKCEVFGVCPNNGGGLWRETWRNGLGECGAIRNLRKLKSEIITSTTRLKIMKGAKY